MIELAGHLSWANWTRVQGLLMCSLSMISVDGRPTEVLAIPASPGPALRTAVRAGVCVRFMPPENRSASLGPNGIEPQLATWKCSARLATAPWSPVTLAVTENGLQLVGLSANSGR